MEDEGRLKAQKNRFFERDDLKQKIQELERRLKEKDSEIEKLKQTNNELTKINQIS